MKALSVINCILLVQLIQHKVQQTGYYLRQLSPIDLVSNIFSIFYRFVCPHCTECTNIFSSNGGAELARLAQVPHLGTLPIDPRVGVLSGSTASVLNELPDSSTAQTMRNIVQHLDALTAVPTPA